jgi:hypothetical protein
LDVGNPRTTPSVAPSEDASLELDELATYAVEPVGTDNVDEVAVSEARSTGAPKSVVVVPEQLYIPGEGAVQGVEQDCPYT